MTKEGKTLRVVLRWIQIDDNLEPFYKKHGEFFFRTRVSTEEKVTERRLPEEGHWEISDHPRFNKVDLIEEVIYEGPPGESLLVEVYGEEIDQLSENDHLETYRREFFGPPASWVGRKEPASDVSDEPERMSNWRIAYDVLLD